MIAFAEKAGTKATPREPSVFPSVTVPAFPLKLFTADCVGAKLRLVPFVVIPSSPGCDVVTFTKPVAAVVDVADLIPVTPLILYTRKEIM
jgi:hypothetical protein